MLDNHTGHLASGRIRPPLGPSARAGCGRVRASAGSSRRTRIHTHTTALRPHSMPSAVVIQHRARTWGPSQSPQSRMHRTDRLAWSPTSGASESARCAALQTETPLGAPHASLLFRPLPQLSDELPESSSFCFVDSMAFLNEKRQTNISHFLRKGRSVAHREKSGNPSITSGRPRQLPT